MQRSAEHLPFATDSCDVVINIESSHIYESVVQFLAEVKRVLRRGGYLICAYIRTDTGMALFKRQLHSCGLTIILNEDISDQVKRAIEMEESFRQKRNPLKTYRKSCREYLSNLPA